MTYLLFHVMRKSLSFSSLSVCHMIKDVYITVEGEM